MGARRSPIIRELDVPPEVLRRLARRFPARYPVLFDSAADGPLSSTSILVAEPGACLWLDRNGRLGSAGVAPTATSFLAALENWWLEERTPQTAPPLPFAGGWALFLSYEIAQEVEPRLRLPRAALPWQAFALRTPCALIHERMSGRVFIVAEPDAAHRIDGIEADARRTAAEAEAPQESVSVELIEEEESTAYIRRVVRAKEYVRAGDIYQANLSRPWSARLSRDPDVPALYNRLRQTNPAPFAALAQWGGVAILSSSPERLVRVRGSHIDTRPIAGTRPRSRRPGGDLAEMTELAAHPKERAEHIMLIDLERNDLGRVCAAGTVRVDELMSIESYAHVHHIVSNVRGRIRGGVTPGQAIAAVFPGGTITGCPKVRCMEIIAELERAPRGPYTGALGHLCNNGDLDLNILIRTLHLYGDEIIFRAGAGIVADSDPAAEQQECINKAKALFRAAEEARRFASAGRRGQ